MVNIVNEIYNRLLNVREEYLKQHEKLILGKEDLNEGPLILFLDIFITIKELDGYGYVGEQKIIKLYGEADMFHRLNELDSDIVVDFFKSQEKSVLKQSYPSKHYDGYGQKVWEKFSEFDNFVPFLEAYLSYLTLIYYFIAINWQTAEPVFSLIEASQGFKTFAEDFKDINMINAIYNAIEKEVSFLCNYADQHGIDNYLLKGDSKVLTPKGIKFLLDGFKDW